MSTNASLLTSKQKILEKEKERLEFLQSEEKRFQFFYDDIYSYAKKENWYPDEPYYK